MGISASPPAIKKRFDEVALSNAVACGIYYGGQGGDGGVHTGEAHKDFVDISLARALVGLIFAAVLLVSLCSCRGLNGF